VTVFGIDARAATEEPAGGGRYVRELLTALAGLGGDERYELWSREPWDGGPREQRFVWRRVGAPDPLWHALVALRASRSCDAYLSTNSYLTAWGLRVPCAIVVFDLISFVEPQWAQPRAARIEKATIGRAVRRADRIVCISEATRGDLLTVHPEAAERARVVPLAAGAAFGADGPRAERERPYVLTVGTLEPRKNLELLIDAWASLPESARGDHELLIVGPRGWQEEAILRRAGGRSGDVRVLGLTPDPELAALYRGCTLFAYPSLYEGFGLPVIEAMACGAPVVTSNASSLPEVAGDAARLVDPHSLDELAAAIAELLGDEGARRELARLGPAQAASYSWERTARETRELLRELVS
jgi:glycosyltransferase involved in cell wall biosynthesis